jgi:hypothetical protein
MGMQQMLGEMLKAVVPPAPFIDDEDDSDDDDDKVDNPVSGLVGNMTLIGDKDLVSRVFLSNNDGKSSKKKPVTTAEPELLLYVPRAVSVLMNILKNHVPMLNGIYVPSSHHLIHLIVCDHIS